MKAIVLLLLPLCISLVAGPTRADSGADPISHEVVANIRIEGTVWSGKDSLGEACTFRYLKGGVLNYTTPSGTFQNGTWKQREGKVYMEMNGKYAEYDGVLEGESIVGRARNRAGLRWTWDVKMTRESGK